MYIGDIVNVKNSFYDELLHGMSPHWKGKVIEIRNGGKIITVQDKGIKFAEIHIDDLEFRDGEYWEKAVPTHRLL